MFIRYNNTLKVYEYDSSGGAGTGPWVKLQLDYSQLINAPIIPSPPDMTNVAYKNQVNTFTQKQKLQFSGPSIELIDTDRPADAKLFRIINLSGGLYLQAANDAVSTNQGFVSIGRNGDLAAQGLLFERNRTVAVGNWQSIPFVASDFFAVGGGTWTVGSAAVLSNRYALVGKTMFWSIYLSWFSGANVTAGNITQLGINVPAGLTATNPYQYCPVAYAVDSAIGQKEYIAAHNGPSIVFFRKDGTVTPPGGATGFITNMTWEIG